MERMRLERQLQELQVRLLKDTETHFALNKEKMHDKYIIQEKDGNTFRYEILPERNALWCCSLWDCFQVL